MMMSLSLMTVAALAGAKPDSAAATVQFDVRICRGDPKGTLRVLAAPSATTIPNRSAKFLTGGERVVIRDRNVEYVPIGISLTLTPRSIDKRTAEVEVEFEDSSRANEPKLRAAMSGRFVRGEPVRLFLPTPAGEPRVWAEISVNKGPR